MMTREEFLETSNSRLAAEALLTQYDLEQAQEKILGYIGTFSTMQEYLDFLADHKLERELFKIDYKDRIYLFRQILSIKYEDLKESENLEMIEEGNTILMPNSKFKVLKEDWSYCPSLSSLGGAFDNGSKRGLHDYWYGLKIEVENEKKEKETFQLGYWNSDRMELTSYDGYELQEDYSGSIYGTDDDFEELREFCEDAEEILELINEKAHEKSKEMLIDLLEEKLKKFQDGDIDEDVDSELIEEIIDDVESQLEYLK